MTIDSPPHQRPRLSVIVPSFNSGSYIGDAITSVLTQSGPSIEILVQDGGSTDQTQAVVQRLDDTRVTFHQEPDGGQADALNRALQNARGEWVLWLNADDLVAPGALTIIETFLDGDWDIVYGAFALADRAGHPVKYYFPAPLSRERLLRFGTYIFSGAMVVRAETLTKLGGFNGRLHYCMDFELLLRLAPVARATQTEQVLAYLREQPESKTSTRPWRMYREHWMVARRYGAFAKGRVISFTGLAVLSAAYVATRRIWQSGAWRRVRPTKRRGGSGPVTAIRRARMFSEFGGDSPDYPIDGWPEPSR